jgi:hypothetical protein
VVIPDAATKEAAVAEATATATQDPVQAATAEVQVHHIRLVAPVQERAAIAALAQAAGVLVAAAVLPVEVAHEVADLKAYSEFCL